VAQSLIRRIDHSVRQLLDEDHPDPYDDNYHVRCT
jgi:hypothetical protein